MIKVYWIFVIQSGQLCPASFIGCNRLKQMCYIDELLREIRCLMI